MNTFIQTFSEIILPALHEKKSRIFPCGDGMDARPFLEAYPSSTQSHTYFESFWILEGCAPFKIDGKIYEMNAGDFCLLPPGRAHADSYNKSTFAYRSLWMTYRHGITHFHFFEYQPVGKWNVPQQWHGLHMEEMKRLLPALQAEIEQSDQWSPEAAMALLWQIEITALRGMEAGLRDPALAQNVGTVSRSVIRFLEKHYAEPLSLDEIARQAFLSSHYLSEIFKRETGQTIFEALEAIRIRQAQLLLMENKYSIFEISAKVGYKSPQHFSRVFRLAVGMPPSQYGA